MTKISIFILFSVLLFAILIFIWLYVFNIYETRITVNPSNLSQNYNSKVVIEAIPLNSFGKKAIFRSVSIKYDVISGNDLVRIAKTNENKINVYSNGEVGEVEILITLSVGMFPTKVKILIN